MHFHSLSLSEWQLCFSCQDRLNRSPINKHGGGEMEMSCPSSGPTEDVPFQHLPKPQILGAFNERPTSYLDLAFCLRAAATAGFGAGSGADEGLTESYRLRHLQQNMNQRQKTKTEQKGVPVLFE